VSVIDRAVPPLYRSLLLHDILPESYLSFGVDYKIMWFEIVNETQSIMGKHLG
jgi:hypothetical protein